MSSFAQGLGPHCSFPLAGLAWPCCSEPWAKRPSANQDCSVLSGPRAKPNTGPQQTTCTPPNIGALHSLQLYSPSPAQTVQSSLHDLVPPLRFYIVKHITTATFLLLFLPPPKSMAGGVR